QPAYEVLETAFATLSDSEKSVAKGNLFAGLAGTEYLEEFKPGDFLIRTIIGADPGSGAVVIGGIPRTGQTLQYQLRDRDIAKADLKRVLATDALHGVRPFATLLFSCLGRGQGFFGSPNHDASGFFAAAGRAPLAGFFCNGEIAPVAGRNAVHGFTAAAALWIEKSD
ncbi:MAG: FIST C-terminal domain-containing protein, partial [Verrucomicrobiota bacterium]